MISSKMCLYLSDLLESPTIKNCIFANTNMQSPAGHLNYLNFKFKFRVSSFKFRIKFEICDYDPYPSIFVQVRIILVEGDHDVVAWVQYPNIGLGQSLYFRLLLAAAVGQDTVKNYIRVSRTRHHS